VNKIFKIVYNLNTHPFYIKNNELMKAILHWDPPKCSIFIYIGNIRTKSIIIAFFMFISCRDETRKKVYTLFILSL